MALSLCSASHTVAVINTEIKSNLGKKGSIWIACPCHSPSSREARAGPQAGQEPGSRDRSRVYRGMLLTDLLSVASSLSFRVLPRTTCLGILFGLWKTR